MRFLVLGLGARSASTQHFPSKVLGRPQAPGFLVLGFEGGLNG